MVNPLTSKSHFEKLIFNQCCFFFTLRAGSLIIGIFQLVIGILWLIGGVARGASGFSGLISTVFMIVSGILTILAIKKESAKHLWWSIYLNICLIIWLFIFIIIMFVSAFWGLAIGGIVNAIVLIYFTSVLRSYAFEVDSSGSAAPTTTA